MINATLKGLGNSVLLAILVFTSFCVYANNQAKITPESIALVNHYIHPDAGEQRDSNRVRSVPKVVLFVSLGMPTLVLRQYFKQAHEMSIPVVIRGMYEGNMHETGRRLYNILNPKGGKKIVGGAQIDPVWFRKFDIKVVPALVASVGFEHSIVYGNVPIKKQLQIIKTKSSYVDVKELASSVLEGHKK